MGIALSIAFGACSHLGRLEKNPARVGVHLPRQQKMEPAGTVEQNSTPSTKPIIYTKANGDTLYFAPVERDEATGEQIMSMQIEQVTITASAIRSVVERMGKINLEFVVTVPDSLLAGDWRLTLRPLMLKGSDSVQLDNLVFSGERFRMQQQRQYARYARYLRGIVDSADFFRVFGDIGGFERYLREAGEELLRMRELRRHADTLDAERAVRDRLVWTYDKDEYGISLRELMRYNRHIDRLIRRKTLYLKSGQDPFDHLNDFLTPRYKYTAQDTVLVGGELYTRLVDDRDQARRRDTELQQLFDSLQHTPRKERTSLSRRWQRALCEARLKCNTIQRHLLTGIVSPRETAILQLLSDSVKNVRFDIRKRAIDSRIRLLTSLDTVELMRRYRSESKIARNEQHRAIKDEVFARMVRFPYMDGLRLDSVVRGSGAVSYHYTQQVQADEYSSKLFICLDGDITDIYAKQHTMQRSDTLTFSVATMMSFLDTLPRYVQRVITRNAVLNERFNFVFSKNKTKLDERLGSNAEELNRLKTLTRNLMTDPVFIIDSIVLQASSSPEGNYGINDRLARERAVDLKRVVDREFRMLYDSLHISAGYALGANGVMERVEVSDDLPDLPSLLRVESLAENWPRLRQLVERDTTLRDKAALLELFDKEEHPDRREALIRRQYPQAYGYMSQNLYPKLRAVDFRFNLQRRGMQQDTVYMTELDSTYLRGRKLLEKRRYEEALTILRSYENDHNTALAYMSLGYDKAALRIFSSIEESADVKYLMAILCSRMGDEQTAVQHFLRAVEIQPRLRFRGNLDPEIARLIKKYNLFPDEF